MDVNSEIENLKISTIGTVDLTQMLGKVLNFVRPLIDHGINLRDIQQLASDEYVSRQFPGTRKFLERPPRLQMDDHWRQQQQAILELRWPPPVDQMMNETKDFPRYGF